MLCDECNNNEAQFSVSVFMEGEQTVRHLCPDCMARLNQRMNPANITNLLSSIMAAITGAQQKRTNQEAEDASEMSIEDIACPRCGMNFSQYKKTGRLGCAACYNAFREQLQPMLEQIHGRVQHAGRVPLNTADAQRHRTRREELQRAMDQAVEQEDFETAARIRDQLRAMDAEEVNA